GRRTLRPDPHDRGRRDRRGRGAGTLRAAASLAISGLLRSPARALTRVLVVAAAVGLLGATLLFIGNSLRTMAGSTIRSVPIDWQGPVGSYAEEIGRAHV